MKLKTIADPIAEFESKKSFTAAIIATRHNKYIYDAKGEHQDKNQKTLEVLNLVDEQMIHRSSLSPEGREAAIKQGERLYELGIPISRIYVGTQGRGPENALKIAQGYGLRKGIMPPLFEKRGFCDFPVYTSVKKTLWAKYEKFGPCCAANWMNGEIYDLCKETPEHFKQRMSDSVYGEIFETRKIVVAGTHWENIIYLRGAFVLNRESNIPTDWTPANGAGVLIILDTDSNLHAYEFDNKFNIVENN